jgi:enterochelin esterase-like enzyme
MDVEKLVEKRRSYSTVVIEERVLYSEFLERDVIIDVYLPLRKVQAKEVNLLLINDGQDLRTMDFAALLDRLYAGRTITPVTCIGIHCSADRINEYGTAYRADYMGRGAKAGLYNKFVLAELLPYLQEEFDITFIEKSFAGFSLGALSALDIVWNNPNEFTKVGVFSGSLWWRRRSDDDPCYDWNKDRIMHLQVQKASHYPWLQFFFECGQLDETADRNNNGIIDSIEDTTDLIADLKANGYTNGQIRYLELEDGGHNIETWADAFPAFLKWGWGKKA